MPPARRIGRLLPIMLLPLSACARQPPTEEEARQAAKSCGMIMQDMYGGSAFDKVFNVIVMKQMPPTEFDKSLDCLRWRFFVSRIEASVQNGRDGDSINLGF